MKSSVEEVHSTLGASSASRWIACPGSNQLCEKMPEDKGSEYAAEGTAAHALAEDCLRNGIWASECIGKTYEGYEVTSEMADAVDVYLQEVTGLTGELGIEKKFELDFIQEGMFGTNDASVYDKKTQTLHILDYKHGRGVAVEATRNPQLMYYALGAAKEIITQHGPNAIANVQMVIVQPRASHHLGPIRGDTIAFEDLTTWAVLVLAPAARATLDPDAPLNPGPKQCQWCRAKAACPALAKKAAEVAKVDFSHPVFPDPAELTPEDLAKLITFSDGFSDYGKACKAYAQTKAEEGVLIPGHKLVKGRTLRKWSPDSGHEEALRAALGEAAFDKKLKSPAQIEKAMKAKGLDPNLSAWTFKPEGKLMLVPYSDKRAEILAAPGMDFIDVFS